MAASHGTTKGHGIRDGAAMPRSVFSVDVEDWFNLSGTGLEPPPSEWDGLESRIERNLRGVLELLAEGGGTATCFFVGYFAKRFPHLVREAVAAGHEIASHGYFHRLATTCRPAIFSRMRWRRACCWRIFPERRFAASALRLSPLPTARHGFSPSSWKPATVMIHPYSPRPTKPAASRPQRSNHTLSRPSAGTLAEFPITAVRVLGKPMCFFGGGYLRLFPYPLIRAMGYQALREGRPVIFYVHPREIDPGQPRLPVGRRRQFTCYVNLRSTRPKIKRILRDFQVMSFDEYISNGAMR